MRTRLIKHDEGVIDAIVGVDVAKGAIDENECDRG